MRIELSRRGDYAVRAALGLAILDGDRPVSARLVAARMGIPPRFVAHVLTDLVRAGVVIGTPGRSGGYRLATSAREINLLRIVDAVEDRGEVARCVIRGTACRATGSCAVHVVFEKATMAMRNELAAANLADLAHTEPAGTEPAGTEPAGTEPAGALTRR